MGGGGGTGAGGRGMRGGDLSVALLYCAKVLVRLGH